MVSVLLLWIAVLVVVLAGDNHSMIIKIAEATVPVVSFANGRRYPRTAKNNFLHWTYRITTHHPKALPRYGDLVVNAIGDLSSRIINGDWEYDSSSEPCDSVQQLSSLRSIACASSSGLIWSIGEDLDPLGPALVDLMTELYDEYEGKFNVTWITLPQPPNIAEYKYDLSLLTNNSENNGLIYEALDMLDSYIDQAVEDAGIYMDTAVVSSEACTLWPCHDDNTTDDFPNADDDGPVGDTCFHVDCILFTAEKCMGSSVRKVVQQTIQVVNEEYDWFDVTYVPLNASDVGINNSAGSCMGLASDSIVQR